MGNISYYFFFSISGIVYLQLNSFKAEHLRLFRGIRALDRVFLIYL